MPVVVAAAVTGEPSMDTTMPTFNVSPNAEPSSREIKLALSSLYRIPLTMMEPSPEIVPLVNEPVPPLDKPATSEPPPPQPVNCATEPTMPKRMVRRVSVALG